MVKGETRMGLRFILGRSGADKSGRILEEIKEQLIKEPKGAPIYYIVPEQMTFQQEKALYSDPDIQGSIRGQVVSFSRLAWRILQETGGAAKKYISSVGVQMMLRKIIEEKQGEWQTFQKALEKQGFLEQLEQMITEFKRYEITPEGLKAYISNMDQFVHKEHGEEALISKLNDLLYIYEKLNDALREQYMDGEDQLRLLAEKIADSNLLDDAEIYIDGFHSFTPIELSVMEALLEKCQEVTVALTIDSPEQEVSELSLFHQTTETYHILKQLAEEKQIKIHQPVMLEPDEKWKDNPAFAHLERYFDTRPAKVYEGKVPIKVAEAHHPRAEVEGVAQEILQLVREENYRFRDIAVFIREPDTYHALIETIFNDYQIPVFIDEKKSMLHHSLIEFIRSALDTVEGNWRYDAVFRVLKTGFIPQTDETYPLTPDAIDELENYVLEYGIRSRKTWVSEEEWKFQRFRGFDRQVQTDEEKKVQTRINAYRDQVNTILQPFDEQIRSAKTVLERCTAIYNLLEAVGAPVRLEKMRRDYDEAGEIEKGREQEQVWNAVIQLLDEMVEMAGEEKMSLSVFRSVLDAGLETLKFSHVPPTLDHVIVGTIDRSRVSGVKCAFLLGVNEGTWPMKPDADGLINEEERELLKEHGLKLADSAKRKLLDDWFYMYLAFTAATDQLMLSYPISNEEGNAKMPSQLIRRMEELFPDCSRRLLFQDAEESLEADRFITTPATTRAALTAQLNRYLKGYPMKDVWWHVLNWYMENEAKGETTYHILQSLFYENNPKQLSKENIERIYPKTVKASVSRLETYFRCSYQYFAKYSLGLDERKTYKLDAPDIGQLFHEALKIISEWVQQEGKDFAVLTKEDSEQYARKAVSVLSPVLQHQILHSSNRYKYIQKKLQDVIAKAAFILSEQARRSEFIPVGLEVGFGENETLPPLTVDLDNGYGLMLRGRIDRVDKSTSQDSLYLRIIDYKSSEKDLNLVEVYYGLALQMLAYLDVVLTYSEKWLGMKATPAGVLYFHVHNPFIQTDEKIDERKIENEMFKKYKMKGLLLSDEEVVRHMDTSLDSGYSDIVPAALKRNGEFYSNSSVASEAVFTKLKNHIHELMKRAGLDITGGGIHLNPFQFKQQTACTYCPFMPVCQFDPLLESNEYRKLKNMDEKEVLKKMMKEEGEDGSMDEGTGRSNL